MPELSIVSAAVDSPEFLELLVRSIWRFTKQSYEVIIVDNGSLPENLEWVKAQDNVHLIENNRNLGHGMAMDQGTKAAQGRFVCVLDIDAHLQREGWDVDLRAIYEENPRTRLVGCLGPTHKPLHPPLFFYERDFIIEHGISFMHIPSISTDTAQKAYWDILGLGYEVVQLKKGFKVYDCVGDEVWINEKPTIYHSWYGTRFCHNHPTKRKAVVDGYTIEAFLENKAKLFEQETVKEIMGR